METKTKTKIKINLEPKYFLTVVVILTTLSLTSATKADVNMKNASFLSHWLDLAIEGPGASLEVRRFYNSRSARIGLFGFGWCSSFEKSLRIIGETIALSDCSLEGDKEIKDVKRGPAGYDIQRDQTAMQFDTKGRLTKMTSPEGLEMTLIYSKENRLTQIKTADGRKIDFIYDKRGGRVIEVRSSTGEKIKYQYTGDDLIAVISKKQQAKYTYDDAHNLIRIEHPDKRYELVVYDDHLDRVKKYKAVNGCLDTFQYQAMADNNYVSSAARTCGERIVGRATYRFVHSPTNNTFLPVAREISSEPTVATREPQAAPKNWGVTAIRAQKAQPLAGKNKVIVAIIDTGVDTKLPTIKNSLWKNNAEILNGRDDDGNGFIDDIHGFNFAANSKDISDQHGHGTHVAGIIKAIAPHAELMILKYYEPGAHLANINSTVKAIEYAVKMGAHIINYSGGGPFANPAERKALEEAAKKNILLVAAAGNDGVSNDATGFYPASYGLPNIISVASMTPLQTLLNSSNYGQQTVDIAAPGLEIESLMPGGQLGPMSGTSQATAFVSGVAALILSQNSGASFTAVKERITNFSKKINPLSDMLRSSAVLDAYTVLANRDASVNAFEISVVTNENADQVDDPRYLFSGQDYFRSYRP